MNCSTCARRPVKELERADYIECQECGQVIKNRYGEGPRPYVGLAPAVASNEFDPLVVALDMVKHFQTRAKKAEECLGELLRAAYPSDWRHYYMKKHGFKPKLLGFDE